MRGKLQDFMHYNIKLLDLETLRQTIYVTSLHAKKTAIYTEHVSDNFFFVS